MPEITFNQAQKALGHLNKKRNRNGMEDKPPLLEVSGWEKSKIVYTLKSDIESAFKQHIERFRDLDSEARKLEQERANLKQKKNLTKENEKRIDEIAERTIEINNEISDIVYEKQEVNVTQKLTEEKFGDIINGEMFTDLGFAINLEPA